MLAGAGPPSGDAAMTAEARGETVWVVLRSGDYVGIRSVHATQAGASESVRARGGPAKGYYIESWAVAGDAVPDDTWLRRLEMHECDIRSSRTRWCSAHGVYHCETYDEALTLARDAMRGRP